MKRLTIVIIAIMAFGLTSFGQEKESKVVVGKKNNTFIRVKPDKDVTLIFNGNKYSSDILELIDPDKIESISVLKGEEAEKEYDENNVIIITAKKKIEEKNKIVIRGSSAFDYSPENPLIVIDGKMKTKTHMDNLSPNDIESVSVLKGESAIEAYGDKAKNGVIVIKTKKKQEVNF